MATHNYLNAARTQELINEIKSRLAGKADTASTLSGYGISDAYTKTEVDDKVDAALSSVYRPGGSVAFANLPALAEANVGKVVNVTDAFITTADFVEGAGKSYPAGTNVVVCDVGSAGSPSYKYDAQSGIIDTTPFALNADFVDITAQELAAMWTST